MKLIDYRDLDVWQRAMNLSKQIYRITEGFPAREVYGLALQMRKCAISIPSNIAEGSRKFSKKEYAKYISIAFGSGAELETQLEIARDLGIVSETQKVEELLSSIMRMLNRLHSKLKS